MDISDIRKNSLVSKIPVFPVLIIKRWSFQELPQGEFQYILSESKLWCWNFPLWNFNLTLGKKLSLVPETVMTYFTSRMPVMMYIMLKFVYAIVIYTSFLGSKCNDLIYLDLINIPQYYGLSLLLHGFRQLNSIFWNIILNYTWWTAIAVVLITGSFCKWHSHPSSLHTTCFNKRPTSQPAE